jgi:hypothetical protein
MLKCGKNLSGLNHIDHNIFDLIQFELEKHKNLFPANFKHFAEVLGATLQIQK